jgi:hypothetical protein
MDRVPGWIRVLAASAWMVGLVAGLAGSPGYVWRPTAGDRWLFPTSPAASIVDSSSDVVVLDPFVTAEHEVGQLHAGGRAVVCQLRAGVWEPARPDAGRFDLTLLGDLTLVGGAAGADDRWLDVRRPGDLAEALGDRLALCAGKGFDGVLLTDLDGYAYPTGFPVTADDQLRFNTALVAIARQHGLRVAVVATRLTPVPSTVDITVSQPRPAGGAGSAGTSTTTGS